MKMSKVGNQTNSQDPQAVNSRVFVGNLNTFQCSKTDVERIFQRYGRLAGISMHKGFAFVQFTNPFDARSACLGEDGRTILSQILDVNLVAEPKLHQTGRKRQNVSKTGNDWDYYYDSYYAAASIPTLLPRTGPPLKRPRLTITANKTPKLNLADKVVDSTSSDKLKKYNVQEQAVVIQRVRELFTEIQDLLEHKKTYCKLRFTCKCRPLNGFRDNYKSGGDSIDTEEEKATFASLLCVQCKEPFHSAWELLVHVQSSHQPGIYSLDSLASSTSPAPSPRPCTPDKECDSSSRLSSANDTGNDSCSTAG